MVVKIFCGPYNYDLTKLYKKEENEFLIGVDQGALIAIDLGISLDLALGDFDSVNEDELLKIKKSSKNIETFNRIKDYTDSFLAVTKALELNADEIVLYGGLGKRLDHTFANLNLLKLGRVSIVNNQTKTYMLDPGEYEISNEYKYISFFGIEDVKDLSISGFKYELSNIELDVDNPLCISNEGNGSVAFKEGLLLVIHQDE